MQLNKPSTQNCVVLGVTVCEVSCCLCMCSKNLFDRFPHFFRMTRNQLRKRFLQMTRCCSVSTLRRNLKAENLQMWVSVFSVDSHFSQRIFFVALFNSGFFFFVFFFFSSCVRTMSVSVLSVCLFHDDWGGDSRSWNNSDQRTVKVHNGHRLFGITWCWG